MQRQASAITIDGGGTGTRLRAIDAQGAALAEAAAGPSSLTLGVEQAWRNVAAGLDAIGTATGAAPDGLPLLCGLAGSRSPERQARFRALARPRHDDIVIVSDGFAALLGAHGGRPGVVLAIGTGVAACGLGPDGRVSRASGWGFAIGDEGGGAWIGRRALSLFSRHLDGRLEGGSALFDALRAGVGAEYDAIQSWLAEASATRFATLAPLVIEAAAAGDDMASGLMAEATAELERAVGALDATGPVALLGGLGPVFAPRLAPRLGARLRPPRGTALDGLALMARRGWRDETGPALERRDG